MRYSVRFLFSILSISLFVIGCHSTTDEKKTPAFKKITPQKETSSKVKKTSQPSTAQPQNTKVIPNQKTDCQHKSEKKVKQDECIVCPAKTPKTKRPPKTPPQIKKKPSDKKQTYYAVNVLVPASKKTSPFLDSSSFITNWTFIGPFQVSSNDKTNASLINQAFITDETGLRGNDRSKWKAMNFAEKSADKPGEIDISRIFPNKNFCASYAVATLYAPKRLNHLTMYTGSSCLLKIWLNKQLIHTYDTGMRKREWDQDEIMNISLNKGYNTLIVKTVHFTGAWSYFLRFTDQSGVPICVDKNVKVAK